MPSVFDARVARCREETDFLAQEEIGRVVDDLCLKVELMQIVEAMVDDVVAGFEGGAEESNGPIHRNAGSSRERAEVERVLSSIIDRVVDGQEAARRVHFGISDAERPCDSSESISVHEEQKQHHGVAAAAASVGSDAANMNAANAATAGPIKSAPVPPTASSVGIQNPEDLKYDRSYWLAKYLRELSADEKRQYRIERLRLQRKESSLRQRIALLDVIRNEVIEDALDAVEPLLERVRPGLQSVLRHVFQPFARYLKQQAWRRSHEAFHILQSALKTDSAVGADDFVSNLGRSFSDRLFSHQGNARIDADNANQQGAESTSDGGEVMREVAVLMEDVLDKIEVSALLSSITAKVQSSIEEEEYASEQRCREIVGGVLLDLTYAVEQRQMDMLLRSCNESAGQKEGETRDFAAMVAKLDAEDSDDGHNLSNEAYEESDEDDEEGDEEDVEEDGEEDDDEDDGEDEEDGEIDEVEEEEEEEDEDEVVEIDEGDEDDIEDEMEHENEVGVRDEQIGAADGVDVGEDREVAVGISEKQEVKMEDATAGISLALEHGEKRSSVGERRTLDEELLQSEALLPSEILKRDMMVSSHKRDTRDDDRNEAESIAKEHVQLAQMKLLQLEQDALMAFEQYDDFKREIDDLDESIFVKLLAVKEQREILYAERRQAGFSVELLDAVEYLCDQVVLRQDDAERDSPEEVPEDGDAEESSSQSSDAPSEDESLAAQASLEGKEVGCEVTVSFYVSDTQRKAVGLAELEAEDIAILLQQQLIDADSPLLQGSVTQHVVDMKYHLRYKRRIFEEWESFWCHLINPIFFGYSARSRRENDGVGDHEKRSGSGTQDQKHLEANFPQSSGISMLNPTETFSERNKETFQMLNSRSVLPEDGVRKKRHEDSDEGSIDTATGTNPEGRVNVKLDLDVEEFAADIDASSGRKLRLYRPNMSKLTAKDVRRLKRIHKASEEQLEEAMRLGLVDGKGLRPEQFDAIKTRDSAFRLYRTARQRFKRQCEGLAEGEEEKAPPLRITEIDHVTYEGWVDEVRNEEWLRLKESREAAALKKVVLKQEAQLRRTAAQKKAWIIDRYSEHPE